MHAWLLLTLHARQAPHACTHLLLVSLIRSAAWGSSTHAWPQPQPCCKHSRLKAEHQPVRCRIPPTYLHTAAQDALHKRVAGVDLGQRLSQDSGSMGQDPPQAPITDAEAYQAADRGACALLQIEPQQLWEPAAADCAVASNGGVGWPDQCRCRLPVLEGASGHAW